MATIQDQGKRRNGPYNTRPSRLTISSDTAADAEEILEGRRGQRMVKQKTARSSPDVLISSDEERSKAADKEAEKQLSNQDGHYTPG